MATQEEKARLQAFFELVETAHRGEISVELPNNISMGIEAVRRRHKPAVVTLRITIAPSNSSDDDVLHISLQSSVKLPTVQRGVSTYFADENNNLSRQRMNQPSLFDDGPRLVSGTVIRPGETERQAEQADADFADDRSIAQ